MIEPAITGTHGSTHGRFFVVPHSRHPVDRERLLVRLGDPARIVLLTQSAARVAALACGARSLEEHVISVANATGLSREIVGEAVVELRTVGLLQPFHETLGDEPSLVQRRWSPITAVGIMTADRPQMVERSLGDIVHHKRRFGSPRRVYVIDGSRSFENEERTREVTNAARDFIDAVHVGALERARVTQRLVAAGADPAVVRHCLDGGDSGGNRNLFVLLTAGESVLMCDDDIRWMAWAPTDCDDAVMVGNHENPFRTSFFDSRQAAVQAITVADVDLLKAHEVLLGRSAADLDGGAPDLSEGCGDLLSRLANGSALRVRVTMGGLAGDDGSVCGHNRLVSVGEERRKLLRDHRAFVNAIRSREQVRSVRQPVITHSPYCMAYFMGLDNTKPLSIFLPTGRNEDGVFGLLAGIADHDMCVGYIPWGVVHDSSRPALRYSDVIASATNTWLSEVVRALMDRAGQLALTRRTQARAISATLRTCGDLSPREFVIMLTEALLAKRSGLAVRMLQEMERDGETPSYWRAEVQEFGNQLARAAVQDEFIRPVELRNVDGWLEWMMRFIADFGTAIDAWPELWRLAEAQGTGALLRN